MGSSPLAYFLPEVHSETSAFLSVWELWSVGGGFALGVRAADPLWANHAHTTPFLTQIPVDLLPSH